MLRVWQCEVTNCCYRAIERVGYVSEHTLNASSLSFLKFLEQHLRGNFKGIVELSLQIRPNDWADNNISVNVISLFYCPAKHEIPEI